MADRFSHIKQWRLSLISGIVFVLLGIFILVAQITTYADFSILLAIAFIIVGGLRAFYGLYNKRELKYWALLFINGLIEFFVFLIPMFVHSVTEDILPVYVGFILLFRTILGIGISMNFYYSKLKGWFIVFIFSILGVIAAFFMIWKPVSSGMTILIYPALTLLFVGITQFGIAFGLKKLNREIAE